MKQPNYLDSSKFIFRAYQDLGEGSKSLELPFLSNAIFSYKFAEEEENPFADEYFQVRDFLSTTDGDDDEEEDEGGDAPLYEVTISYYVNRSVLIEIAGAFPLPPDADLIFEIVHLDDNNLPVFKHLFRGWPLHNDLHAASIKEKSTMVHTLSLQCETFKLFDLSVNGESL